MTQQKRDSRERQLQHQSENTYTTARVAFLSTLSHIYIQRYILTFQRSIIDFHIRSLLFLHRSRPIYRPSQLLKREEDEDRGRLQPRPRRDPSLKHEHGAFVSERCPDHSHRRLRKKRHVSTSPKSNKRQSKSSWGIMGIGWIYVGEM